MIIPNSSFDLSSIIVLSNKNYLQEVHCGARPTQSAIATTDGAVEPNLIHNIDFFPKEIMMQSSSLQDEQLSSSKAFGWGDFPLLQQSMVTVQSEGVSNDCSRLTPSPFQQDCCESPMALSSSFSFDTMSPVSSSLSLCSTDDSSQSSLRSQRKVQFAKVQIREYALTLGDHPWCENGFPLSLDWKFAPQQELSIDEYEHERMSECEGDRTPRKLDVWERRNLLRRVSCYSTSDLNGMERLRVQQLQRELLMSCQDDESESISAPTTSSERSMPSSRMLRHSNTLQNLSSACV